MKHSPTMQPDLHAGPVVAILLPDLRGGGAETVMLTLTGEFKAQGYAPVFLLAQAKGALLDDAYLAGFPVIDLNSKRLRGVSAPLRHWLRHNPPAILLPAMWPLTCIAIWAARGTGVPVITTDHATLSRQYASKGPLHRMALRTSIRTTYPRALANVAVSHGSARDIERLGRLPRDRVNVIHNPVAPPKPSMATANWSNGARHRVLSVGNLRWQKDFPTLIRAMRQLLDQGADAELVILGEGPERGSLEALISELDLEHRVSLPGFTKDTAAFFQTSTVFALSSCSEGFANVIVEALSHGLPVVATDCPHGPAEILEHGAHGALVPVGDPTALAQALLDGLHRRHDPVAARQRACDFAPKIAAQKYSSLFPIPSFPKLKGQL
ncbi:glycosyltransferase [Aliiroseovarius sp. 2305UL8-7]|uniref:glycosyltransferase n=1 Tax=Aliiroseovarius conchicola TaxID=3121637 RepID=UPI0035285EE1